MPLKGKYHSWEKYLPYLSILVIIFIGNILSIWGFNGLVTDDQGYYFSSFEKTVHDLTFRRNILHSLYTLGVMKLAISTSVYFARLVSLLFLSIPAAFLIYYILRNHYRLGKIIAVVIAILPFILANELKMPTYLSGNYLLMAVLFMLLSLHFIMKFSLQPGFSVGCFLLTVSSYYFATESSELTASMLPVFLFPLFIYRKWTVKQFVLGIAIAFIAIRKALMVISKPHGLVNNVHNDLSAAEINYRILHFLDFINPLHGLPYLGIFNILLILLITLAAILVYKDPQRLINLLDPVRKGDKHLNKSYVIVYYFIYPLIWIIFSAIPFLFFSMSFNSRYFMVSSIGLNFLLVISLVIALSLVTKNRFHIVIVLILLLLLSGLNRQVHFIKGYEIPEYQYNYLRELLVNKNLPENAQILITSPADKWLSIGGGTFTKSTGALQYIMQRRDVSGQIMKEKSYYDPFMLYNKPFIHRLADIDTAMSTFLFRFLQNNPDLNKRLNLALRWEIEHSKDSPWTLFHFNEQGQATNLISGSGYKAYESAVDSLSAFGIRREDIMFGGIPEQKDSLRLGLRKGL